MHYRIEGRFLQVGDRVVNGGQELIVVEKTPATVKLEDGVWYPGVTIFVVNKQEETV